MAKYDKKAQQKAKKTINKIKHVVAKYGSKTEQKVKKAVHEIERGKLKTDRSIQSFKKAIAKSLSNASKAVLKSAKKSHR